MSEAAAAGCPRQLRSPTASHDAPASQPPMMRVASHCAQGRNPRWSPILGSPLSSQGGARGWLHLDGAL